MRKHLRLSAISARLAMVCATLLAGCEEPTRSLDPIEGVFVLRTVGAVPLPAVTGSALDLQFITLADTIVLRADGSGEQRKSTVRRNLTTNARDTTNTLLQLDHERRGNTVRTTVISCAPICDVLPNVADYSLDGGWLVKGPAPIAYRYESVGPGGAF
jgi:hypothetical protein